MRILVGDRWDDGYLDEHRRPGTVRVRVVALETRARLDDLYFVRPRSFRTLWNHARDVGFLWTMRKVVTRLSESSRNEKYASIGVGIVLEADDGSMPGAGDAVAFVAPCHPRAVERLVLPAELLVPLREPLPGDGRSGILVASTPGLPCAPAIQAAFGWNAASGASPPGAEFREALETAGRELGRRDWSGALRLPIATPSEIREHDPARPGPEGSSAVLFGYGNYGKTIVTNNVRHHLAVTGVHELDPTLLPPDRSRAIRWDTSDRPRHDERYDVFLIATYHHAHVPLAVEALRRGAVAVVEKPIATNLAQLSELVRALEETQGRFFAGFHKRYAASNAWARADLAVPAGAPIHYHAVVFEEPLPARHWYRWPSSCSRIVSNGCHWLDHFLFLNDWSEPVSIEVARGGPDEETANVSVRLENGAFFTLALTDVGSARLGVRDHVQLRAGGVTVTIDDGGRYHAEDTRRVLRRRRVNRMSSYEQMYRTIARRIAAGEAGDSLRSVRVSTALVLAAEDAFRAAGRGPSDGGRSR